MSSVRPLPPAITQPPAVRSPSPGASSASYGDLLKSAMARGNGRLAAQVVELMMLSSSLRIAGPQRPPTRLPQYIQAYQLAAQGLTRPPASGRFASLSSEAAEKMTPAPRQTAQNTLQQRQDIDRLITKAARRHKLSHHLVRAVVKAESDYDPACVSSAGAMGLMQLMPETARDLKVSDPFDPRQNIDGGVRYLAMMIDRFDGDLKKALAAYNFGPANVEAGRPWPAETRGYVSKVTRLMDLYSNGFQARV